MDFAAFPSRSSPEVETNMSSSTPTKRKRVQIEIKDEHGEESFFISDEEDDDVDEEDSGEDSVQENEVLWSEAQEPYPSCAAYHPDLPRVQENLLALLPPVASILNVNQTDAETVQNMVEKIQEIRKIPDIQPIRIGLLGDAGVGKSSTMNSLLDIPEIAREGASGRSCTFVVTEYQGPFEDQTRDYAARLQYAGTESIKSMLSDQLSAYRRFDASLDEQWNAEDREEFKLQRDTAFQTFSSLFRDHAEFQSEAPARDYLRDTEDGVIIPTFESWCAQALRLKDLNEEGRYEFVEAATAAALREHVDPSVSSTSRTSGPALWPLLAKVSIGLVRPRVLQHIIFADLPGVSDTNLVRVKATTDYIRTCDWLWLVARGDRVITDRNIDTWLHKYSDRFKGRMSLICTRSDDMDMRIVAQDLRAGEYDTSKFDELSTRSRKLSARIGGLSNKLNNLAKQSKASPQKRMKITDDREELQREKQLVDNERFEVIVTLKNHDVITTLQKDKQDKMPDDMLLPVYCISNRQYARLKGVPDTQQEYHLSAASTGVPELRAYALRLPAKAIVRTLKKYLGHSYTAFFKGVQLWTDRTPVHNHQRLLDIVKVQPKEIDELFNSYTAILKSKLASCLKDPFAANQKKFEDHACAELKTVRAEWNWHTYKAFCLRNGNHKTSVKPQQSWNEKFLEPVFKIIGPSWDEFTAAQDAALDALAESCIERLSAVLKVLDDDKSNMGVNLSSLGDLVDAQCEGIHSAVAQYDRGYLKQDANIRLDTFKDQEQNFFREALSETYSKIGAMGGLHYYNNAVREMNAVLSVGLAASPFAITRNAQ